MTHRILVIWLTSLTIFLNVSIVEGWQVATPARPQPEIEQVYAGHQHDQHGHDIDQKVDALERAFGEGIHGAPGGLGGR